MINSKTYKKCCIFRVALSFTFSCVCVLYLLETPLVSQVQASDSCAIASAHPEATAAGCEVIRKGGNAFDAAIAVTAALGVVEPYSSGLGGGGFYLLHVTESEKDVFIDAREMAPRLAFESLYLDDSGKAVPERSREGPLAAAIPGIPAALQHLSQHYARLSLAEGLRPAIKLAQDGFTVDSRFVTAIGWVEKRLRKSPVAESIFFNRGRVFELGQVLKQPQLAKTLAVLARDKDSFYRGALAREMVDFLSAAGGNWTLADLERYEVKEREPIVIEFNGAKIITAPLPSSGGLVMAQIFHILDGFLFYSQSNSVQTHLLIEAMRRGYNDRARFMGDPDFINPIAHLLSSNAYARKRAKSIDINAATDSLSLPTVYDLMLEGEETTHFSIVDDDGNRVAATLSINGPFGSGMVAGDTGILLNNHMDDFSIGIGQGNSYQLVGNRANGIEAHKRPLSSMSPTFVESEKGVLAIGTPGGSRIISMVVLSVLEYLGSNEIATDAVVSLPRYHHQYLPDKVEIEPESFDKEWVVEMKRRGHDVQVHRRKWGNMQAVHCPKSEQKCVVLNDPRGREGVVF